jgi:cobalt-zinc-cadmium efflux system membrane fusion protein
MMYIKKFLKSVWQIVLFLAIGCGHSEKPVITSTDPEGGISAIYLPETQIRRYGISFSRLSKKAVLHVITCTGYLITDPGTKTTIYAPAAGKIVSVINHDGQMIPGGSELAILENTDFIVLQQNYLEAANLLEFHKEEYTRQGELTVENATSMKKMQIARRDYQSAELTYHSIRLQLNILGISPDSIKPDKLLAVLPVTAPRGGILAKTYIRSGDYVEKGDPLFAMIGRQKQILRINVPEEHFASVKARQVVQGHVTFDSLITFRAEISTIVHEIDPETHSAAAYAELTGSKGLLVSGMSVVSKIVSGIDSVFTIDATAIFGDQKGHFVYSMIDGNIVKYYIITGYTTDGKTEIPGMPDEVADSVIIGGFEKLTAAFTSY